MSQIKWLRNFIRRNTVPLPIDHAERQKLKYSLAYFAASFAAFSLVTYQMFTGKADWAAYYGFKTEADLKLSPAQSWAGALGIKKSKIIRLKGLTKVNEEEYESGKGETSE